MLNVTIYSFGFNENGKREITVVPNNVYQEQHNGYFNLVSSDFPFALNWLTENYIQRLFTDELDDDMYIYYDPTNDVATNLPLFKQLVIERLKDKQQRHYDEISTIEQDLKDIENL